MALQGHPKSLILALIESVYAISYWSSIVISVLSCPISEILQVFGEERPHPYIHPNFRDVPFGLDCRVVAPRSEDPKLIIRVINFELVQPIRPRQDNVTDRRTDDLR